MITQPEYFNTKRERDAWMELNEKLTPHKPGINKAHWSEAEKDFVLTNGIDVSIQNLDRSEKQITEKHKQLTQTNDVIITRKKDVKARVKFSDDIGDILHLNYKNDYSHYDKMPVFTSRKNLTRLIK